MKTFDERKIEFINFLDDKINSIDKIMSSEAALFVWRSQSRLQDLKEFVYTADTMEKIESECMKLGSSDIILNLYAIFYSTDQHSIEIIFRQ